MPCIWPCFSWYITFTEKLSHKTFTPRPQTLSSSSSSFSSLCSSLSRGGSFVFDGLTWQWKREEKKLRHVQILRQTDEGHGRLNTASFTLPFLCAPTDVTGEAFETMGSLKLQQILVRAPQLSRKYRQRINFDFKKHEFNFSPGMRYWGVLRCSSLADAGHLKRWWGLRFLFFSVDVPKLPTLSSDMSYTSRMNGTETLVLHWKPTTS